MSAPFRSQDRQCRGFTFIELVVVGGILIAVITGVLLFLSQMRDAWDLSVCQSDLRVRGEIAVDEMTRELRHTTRLFATGSPPNISIPVPPNNTTITFYLPTDLDGNGLIIDAAGNMEWSPTAVQYSYVQNDKQLQRIANGATRVLANDVSSVFFEDRMSGDLMGVNPPTLLTDEVRITLTLQKSTPRQRVVTMTFTNIVKLRNRPPPT